MLLSQLLHHPETPPAPAPWPRALQVREAAVEGRLALHSAVGALIGVGGVGEADHARGGALDLVRLLLAAGKKEECWIMKNFFLESVLPAWLTAPLFILQLYMKISDEIFVTVQYACYGALTEQRLDFRKGVDI